MIGFLEKEAYEDADSEVEIVRKAAFWRKKEKSGAPEAWASGTVEESMVEQGKGIKVQIKTRIKKNKTPVNLSKEEGVVK